MTYLQQLLAISLLIISHVSFALPQGSINVNTASAEVLAEMLDGIGVARAQAIVEYREKFGDFLSVDDLLDVRGVGPAVIEVNKDKIAFVD